MLKLFMLRVANVGINVGIYNTLTIFWQKGRGIIGCFGKKGRGIIGYFDKKGRGIFLGRLGV